MSTIVAVRAGGVLCVSAALVFAHATWIAPVDAPLEVGKTVNVRIGNGHSFPGSESALNSGDLQVFAVAPSGAKSKLQPGVTGSFLAASYKVGEPGVHRFVLVQDRGIMSRTPHGLKPGGRDQNPGATQSMKMYRAAVAYAGTSGTKIANGKPLGLVFEMLPNRSGDAVTVTVLLNSKPFSGAKLHAIWPGRKEEEVGATGTGGKFTYEVPKGASGPFLLIAAHSEKAAAGGKYDTSDYSTALHLNWE